MFFFFYFRWIIFLPNLYYVSLFMKGVHPVFLFDFSDLLILTNFRKLFLNMVLLIQILILFLLHY